MLRPRLGPLSTDCRAAAVTAAHWVPRRNASRFSSLMPPRSARQPPFLKRHAWRSISIQATPASTTPTIDSPDPAITSLDAPTSTPSHAAPDARFEVLGTTSSLLSIALSASQDLYTRRGTLVGVGGTSNNAISTLSPLSPWVRAPLGIPFLYQRVSSTTPINLLVATKSPFTSFSVLNLDGRVDWMITQRNGLLAWSGRSLAVSPRLNAKMSVAHWGNSTVTGRGLVALAASGNTYQVTVGAGEEYTVHPSSVLAYTINSNAPQPYRFKSSTLRVQLPQINLGLSNTKFVQAMKSTQAYIFLGNLLHTLKIWTRRTVFGDRLFLRFQGPTTILLQSRGSRIKDALTPADASEIANTAPGVVGSSSRVGAASKSSDEPSTPNTSAPAPKLSYAQVGKSGNVSWSDK